jgi:hypothetical protein
VDKANESIVEIEVDLDAEEQKDTERRDFLSTVLEEANSNCQST